MSSTVNGWSRFLGLSLRPWSGESPLYLIIRGAIQLVIVAFLYLFLSKVAVFGSLEVYNSATGFRAVIMLAAIALAVVGLIGLLRIIVGIIDFVPRREITGTVRSLSHRSSGDFLPSFAQRAVFEDSETGLDRRRERLEVVLDTDTGARQWTVRNSKIARQLQVGSRVHLSVTPIAGYVSGVEPAIM